jgi:hypothetical protein
MAEPRCITSPFSFFKEVNRRGTFSHEDDQPIMELSILTETITGLFQSSQISIMSECPPPCSD